MKHDNSQTLVYARNLTVMNRLIIQKDRKIILVMVFFGATKLFLNYCKKWAKTGSKANNYLII